MQTPDSIEAALSRLMPPALSEPGQRAIEAMLDELASATPAAQRRWYSPPWPALIAVPLGIAAALIVWLSLVPRTENQPSLVTAPSSSSDIAAEPVSRLLLVRESDRVEAVTDEGWLGDPDGDAMTAVRFRVIEANTFRDEESGIVVQVSDPRDEVILTPVSVF